MDKKIYYNILGVFFIFAAFFMGYFVYPNFDKGLVMNDEAYYLLHFRDFREMITVDATNYFRIFQIFYTDNIYHFRIITFSLVNASSFLLFFLASRYFKIKINSFLFGFLGICLNFLSWHATIVVLNQYHGNTLLMNMGLSFLLCYLLWKKDFYIILSGFFLGIMLFDGIPHTIAIVPIIFFLFIIYWKKEKSIIFYFFGGMLCAILVYFIFIQDFSSFISQLEYLKIYKTFHKKQHPIRFYVFWVAFVIGFLVIPLSLTIFAVKKFVREKKAFLDRLILVFSILVVILSFFYSNIYILYLLGGLLTYRYFMTNEIREKKFFLLILLSVPFGLAFGSGFYFHLRGGMYQIYYFLAISVIVLRIYELKFYFIFLVWFFWSVIKYPAFIHEKDWKDFVYTEQNVPININGYTLYLDTKRKKDLDDLRPYLQNQPNVIYSKNNLLGYLYILNAKAPLPYYFTLKDYLTFMVKKQGKNMDDYIYIENDEYPFSKKEFTPLNIVEHPEKYRIVKAGRFTLYLPENFKKR